MFICKLCEKSFSSYRSRWNHIKLYHNSCNKIQCSYCLRYFTRKDNYNRHIPTCKKRTFVNNIENINNLTIDSVINSNNITNNTNYNNSNNNCNNETTIINNPIIVQLGHENLSQVFTDEEKLSILSHPDDVITHLVTYVHFNEKYPQFQSIAITNLNNTMGYMYTELGNRFKVVKKQPLISEVVSTHKNNIIRFCHDIYDKTPLNLKKAMEYYIMEVQTVKEVEKSVSDNVMLVMYNNRHMIDITKTNT